MNDRPLTPKQTDALRGNANRLVRRLVATIDGLQETLSRERAANLRLESDVRRAHRMLVVVRHDGSIDVHSRGDVRFAYVPRVSGMLLDEAERYAEESLPPAWRDLVGPTPKARGSVRCCATPERILLARRVDDFVAMTKSLEKIVYGKTTAVTAKAQAQPVLSNPAAG